MGSPNAVVTPSRKTAKPSIKGNGRHFREIGWNTAHRSYGVFVAVMGSTWNVNLLKFPSTVQ